MNLPASNNPADLFGRLGSYCRAEVHEASPIPGHCPAGAKFIPQKIKLLIGIIAASVVILAVHYLCLFRMQLQLAGSKPLLDDTLKPPGLSFTLAMHDDVIGVSLKANVRIVSPHPFIKGIMQEQIGKQWANDSMNAKDNLVFLGYFPVLTQN